MTYHTYAQCQYIWYIYWQWALRERNFKKVAKQSPNGHKTVRDSLSTVKNSLFFDVIPYECTRMPYGNNYVSHKCQC